MQADLLLKTKLLVDGVQIAKSALEGVGEIYKEQVHHLFEYDFDLHHSHVCPAEMRLPNGSVVQVRLNSRSPFLVERNGNSLVILEEGKEITEIEWLKRPDFYNQKTSTGKPMTQIAELVGEDCIAVSHTNACQTFANGKQCAFCNMNYTPKQYDDVLVKKRAAEVGEVVGAAFNQGVAHHFEITGGILPGNREIGILETYFGAFRETTGFDYLPGSAIMTPPDDLKDLERLQRTGLHGVGFNLECFDPAFFKAVCPGKEELIGYDKYREALRAAVEIFGAGGKIFSGFVTGIEPMELLLEGVQELAEEGVASIPMVWSPSSGTRFHNHRPPHPEWFVEMSEKVSSIMIRHLKRDPGVPNPKPVRCTGCQTQVLVQDIIQSRLRLFSSFAA